MHYYLHTYIFIFRMHLCVHLWRVNKAQAPTKHTDSYTYVRVLVDVHMYVY